MRTRWVKTFKDLWANKGRTLLVVVSIAVGVFAVGMIANAYILLDRAVHEGYAAINPASAFVFVSPFDDDLVEMVRALPQIADAEGRRQQSMRINLRGKWTNLDLFALNYDDYSVNLLEPINGKAVPADRELLLDQSALALTEFELGETAVIETTAGKQFTLPIVGSVRDQNSNPSINTGGVNAYTTLDTFAWLGETAAYNRLSFVTQEKRDDQAHIQRVTGEVKEQIERSGYAVFSTTVLPEPGAHPVNFIIRAIRLVLGVLAIVSLALSAFLVYNTMSALIVRQTPTIGIMKAVGAQAGDMIGMYLALVLIFGALAFALAIGPAAWASWRFAQFIASPPILDLRLPAFSLPWQVVGVTLFVSLAVPALAALAPILKGARVSAYAAMNTQGLGAENFGGRRLERAMARIRFATGPGLLALGNVLRNRQRTLLTLSTLILGGAVFIGVQSVSASAVRTVQELGEAYRFDVEVAFERPYRLAHIERLAREIPEVMGVEGWTAVGGTILNPNGDEGNSMVILALPAGSDLTQPTIIDGRWLQPGDTNALVIGSALLRENPALVVGDPIRLKIRGRTYAWTIVGVYRTIGVAVFHEAYANYAYVSRLAREVEQTRRVQLVTRDHDPASQAQAAAAIDEQFRAHGLRVSSIATGSDLRQVQADQFDIVVTVLTVMALLMTLVGGLGLAGTMSMNVLERTREIGVMRALGASDGAVLRVVLVEGQLLAFLSWIVALFLAVPVGRILSARVGMDIVSSPLTYVYSISGAALWLLLVQLTAALASYAPARRASRLTVRDVLAYE